MVYTDIINTNYNELQVISLAKNPGTGKDHDLGLSN